MRWGSPLLPKLNTLELKAYIASTPKRTLFRMTLTNRFLAVALYPVLLASTSPRFGRPAERSSYGAAQLLTVKSCNKRARPVDSTTSH